MHQFFLFWGASIVYIHSKLSSTAIISGIELQKISIAVVLWETITSWTQKSLKGVFTAAVIWEVFQPQEEIKNPRTRLLLIPYLLRHSLNMQWDPQVQLHALLTMVEELGTQFPTVIANNIPCSERKSHIDIFLISSPTCTFSTHPKFSLSQSAFCISYQS